MAIENSIKEAVVDFVVTVHKNVSRTCHILQKPCGFRPDNVRLRQCQEDTFVIFRLGQFFLGDDNFSDIQASFNGDLKIPLGDVLASSEFR